MKNILYGLIIGLIIGVFGAYFYLEKDHKQIINIGIKATVKALDEDAQNKVEKTIDSLGIRDMPIDSLISWIELRSRERDSIKAGIGKLR